MLDGQDPILSRGCSRWILNEEIARVEFQSARFHLIDIDGVDSFSRGQAPNLRQLAHGVKPGIASTAAICGQLAGEFYGESGILEKCLQQLVMGEKIAVLADRLKRDTT